MRKNRMLAVLSVIPIVYLVLFVVALGWWFSFDPSKVENTRLFLVGFWSVVAVHFAVMILTVGLMAYFLMSLRWTGVAAAEKTLWAVVLLLFNILAYPFFYWMYVRPRLRASAESV